MAQVQIDAVELGDENDCDHFVKDASVHVGAGADGQHEARDSSFDPQFLLTAQKHEGQCSRAMRGSTSFVSA